MSMNGVAPANIFSAVEPKAGRHFTTATPDRSGYQFACLVKRIVEYYPQAETIHLIMDNLNIHCRKSLVSHFGEGKGGDLWDRLTVHYTPKHGSWLDQAEIELSLVSRQCLGSRRIPDLETLQREVRAWNRKANQKRTKIDWRFTRKKARKAIPVQEAPGQRLNGPTAQATFKLESQASGVPRPIKVAGEHKINTARRIAEETSRHRGWLAPKPFPNLYRILLLEPFQAVIDLEELWQWSAASSAPGSPLSGQNSDVPFEKGSAIRERERLEDLRCVILRANGAIV